MGKGLDIASKCQDNGYAVPKTSGLHLLHAAMQDRLPAFQCDSLKLNVFCYSQNGCYTDSNKDLCDAMKGDCDVDCNRGDVVAPGALAAVISALAVLVVVL